MLEKRDIRDPIHGFIHLDEEESQLVDSLVVQRLRGIRQLAFANLVYPGAVHTRFEHSLGVCHISGLVAKSLNLSGHDRKLLRFAALLHDIGHGPFSHVSEEVLEIFADRSQLPSETEKIHELITADIIRKNSELCNYIGQSNCDAVAQLLTSGYGDPIIKSIISGPIDTDKQDYLLRDSYFCGVKYGIFDLDQLLRELVAIENTADETKHLGITKDGIHALEQFIIAKFNITYQVYRHKVRLITDQMLVRAIVLGIEQDNIDELSDLYVYKNDDDYIKNYILWDDMKFIYTFSNNIFKSKKCCELIRRLIERKLFKRIYKKNLKELLGESREHLAQLNKPEMRKKRNDIEHVLSEIINRVIGQRVDCNNTIINVFKIKSFYDITEPILIDEKPQPKQLNEESTIFRSIEEKMEEIFIEIYAPIDYDTPVDRREIIKKLDDPISQLLGSVDDRKEESHENQ